MFEIVRLIRDRIGIKMHVRCKEQTGKEKNLLKKCFESQKKNIFFPFTFQQIRKLITCTMYLILIEL